MDAAEQKARIEAAAATITEQASVPKGTGLASDVRPVATAPFSVISISAGYVLCFERRIKLSPVHQAVAIHITSTGLTQLLFSLPLSSARVSCKFTWPLLSGALKRSG